MKLSYRKIIIISIFSGIVAGFILLHLSSMVIHTYYDYSVINWYFLKETFMPEHLFMAFYFTLIGGFIGLFFGFSFYKIKKLYDNLEKLSITDELTSLYNRRYLISKLSEELERTKRYSKFLTIMILDLNNFKQFNDNNGHVKGDILLKNISVLLKDSIRKPDFIARYGGDEFVIVMPETNKNMAHNLAGRLKIKLAQYNFTNPGDVTKEKISFSVGIAGFPDEANNIDELIKKADTELYNSKQRNEK